MLQKIKYIKENRLIYNYVRYNSYVFIQALQQHNSNTFLNFFGTD